LKPLRLYIEDFMCYSNGFIDFTKFNSALIVGKIENNDLYSNGVGKTSIFKSIEYVLFNQADVNLDMIIREDASLCKIVFDFEIDGQEYRLSRSRTRKGATDISLWQRNAIGGPDDEVYHTLKIDDIYVPISDDKLISKYWKDIGGRRASDTEKELGKLVKINFSAFRSTLHFIQNDFTGLSTVTPAKRKGILKDALELGIYSKLEKIAKDKAAVISKDIEKHKTLIDSLKDPESDLSSFKIQLSEVDTKISDKQSLLRDISYNRDQEVLRISDLTSAHSVLESKFSELLLKEKNLQSDKSKLENSIKEYQIKKSNVIKSAQIIVREIEELKAIQVKLASLDYAQIDILSDNVNLLKEEVTKHNLNIQSNVARYEELKIPVPDDNICKHCRQPLTEEHKKACKAQVSKEIADCQLNIKSSKEAVVSLTAQISKLQQEINSLNLSKKKLEDINIQITNKNNEIKDKKVIYEEYNQLLNKFTADLSEKIREINEVKDELNNSSLEEAKNIQSKIDAAKNNLANINVELASINKEIAHLNSIKAVLVYNVSQSEDNINKLKSLKNNLEKLEAKFSIYPNVVQAFSSVGIPNLIIQNVLDDLQIEANAILTQLKPGLQLSFVIEKTKGDGSQDDTLEINYMMNGRKRSYEQLSGAMKLAVIFSLKLGLSFLLQKMIGTDIKFLLLDEIDQSLDKAGVDAFADIVKFFQKDFTILIITHNDRLKDKFSHAILVNQDINMVSKAQVVSTW